MDLTNVKTTAAIAEELAVTPKEIDRILSRYPMLPPESFGKQRAWADRDEERLRSWMLYDAEGKCPHCGDTVETRTPRKARTKPVETPETVGEG